MDLKKSTSIAKIKVPFTKEMTLAARKYPYTIHAIWEKLDGECTEIFCEDDDCLKYIMKDQKLRTKIAVKSDRFLTY